MAGMQLTEPRGFRPQAGSDIVRGRSILPSGVGRIDSIVAVVATLAVGMHVDLTYGLTTGGMAAVALVVLWAAVAGRGRRYRLLLLISGLAAASGVILSLTSLTGGSVSVPDMITRTVFLLTLPAVVGAMIWAAALLGPLNMMAAFGAGMVLGIPFNTSSQDNSWRFTYSLAISVLALAIASRWQRLIPQLVVLGALAAVGLFSDSRSNSSMLLLAAVLVIGQRFVGAQGDGRSRTTRATAVVGIVVIAGYALYSLVISAILDGVFGEVTQQRTESQIARGGSLILGGRPEIAASTTLILRHPFGIGSGTGASYEDVVAAKQAMWGIGYNPDNRYVEQYLFGGSVEVHSMLGDLWLWFGLAGAALVVFLAVVIIHGVFREFAAGMLTPLFAYVAVRFVWDVMFSPAASAMRMAPLTVALALVALGAIGARRRALSEKAAA